VAGTANREMTFHSIVEPRGGGAVRIRVAAATTPRYPAGRAYFRR
jgi:hypothetical protein